MTKAKCGCLYEGSVQFCTLHTAASELLQVAILAVINGQHAAMCEFEISAETKPCDCYMLKLRAAIGKAEGGQV